MIEFQNVSASYGSVPVLKHISFSIGASELVVLLGKSGSGKSTLLKVIAGLLPPTEGEYHFQNKNVYQLSREGRDFTREEAAERLVFLSPERIEKIESGRSAPPPDEVLVMERAYQNPELSNWFCTHECPIGMKYEQEVKLKSLAQVTVETLAALHAMNEEEKRLIAISVDERVSDAERGDFDRILDKLGALDRAIRSMQIWLEHARQSGKIDEAE